MKSYEIKMHFTADGKFITDIAREKCCLNGDLKGAMRLLNEIMVIEPTEPDDPRPVDRYIYDILNGRAELTGLLSPDPNECTINFIRIPGHEDKCDIADALEKFKQKADQAEEKLRIMTNKYLFLIDNLPEYMTQDDMFDIQQSYRDQYDEEDDPAGLQLVREDEMSSDDIFYGKLLHNFAATNNDQLSRSAMSDIKTITKNPSAALSEFVQHMHEESDDKEYGWLEPDGTYHPVPWGEHSKWAGEYLLKHYPFDKYPEIYFDDSNSEHRKYLVDGDVLVYKLNWILIDSPRQGYGRHTCNPNREMTKRQKEFLYDYYREHKNYRAADALYKDDGDI